MSKKNIDKQELINFIKENFGSDKITLEGKLFFFEDLNSVGVHFKEITEILVLGMYENDKDVIEEIKKNLVNKSFKGEFPQAPDFNINKSYYTFYQFSVNYSSKAILMGYYSPVGYHHDMGFNWAKVIDSACYNLDNVKGSHCMYSFK